MFTQLLQYNDLGLFFLRVAIAVIFINHARPKIFKPKMLSAGMGMPAFVVFILGLVESLASIGLVLGIYVQLCAGVLACVMIGATKMKIFNWKVPFWARDKTGWEFDFILFFANVVILLGGGGSIGM